MSNQYLFYFLIGWTVISNILLWLIMVEIRVENRMIYDFLLTDQSAKEFRS